ncbi:hypothetical protein BgiMline_030598 [Biomphalaria glabrata]|nr:neuropeptide FF receptor 2-like [Biomphalaria glabrata]
MTSTSYSLDLNQTGLTTKTVITTVAAADPLVSDFVYNLVSYVILRSVVQVVLRVLGICANVINILVFLKAGPVDSVTAGFLGLAVADLCFLMIFLASIALIIMDKSFAVYSYIDLSSLSFVISLYPIMFGDVSYLITTYLAIQKACCVAIPLRFKNVFTRTRSIAVVASTYVVALVYYCPIFVSMALDLQPFRSTKSNSVKLYLVLSPFSRELLRLFRLVNKTIIPFATQSIVILCLVLLTTHLRRSSKFRQSMKAPKSSNAKGGNTDVADVKGLRAIQSVTLMSAIFVASNLPDICINIATMLVPEFNDRKFLNNLYWVVEESSNIFPIINSSVLILIYLKYNSGYYKQFSKIFRRPSELKKVKI